MSQPGHTPACEMRLLQAVCQTHRMSAIIPIHKQALNEAANKRFGSGIRICVSLTDADDCRNDGFSAQGPNSPSWAHSDRRASTGLPEAM